ncbi:uncharacterized protein BDV14DRAFT_177941, partial [Aspergillus stella-maris]|uniref:uncharacterized protein n=1 Tax=Aspergillus stella-maris TaxID=1810926 RepID=UPI003CCCDC81
MVCGKLGSQSTVCRLWIQYQVVTISRVISMLYLGFKKKHTRRSRVLKTSEKH